MAHVFIHIPMDVLVKHDVSFIHLLHTGTVTEYVMDFYV